MRLDVTYSEEGEVVADLKAAQWFEDLLSRMKNSPKSVHTIEISVGTETMVNAIRVGIMDEQLDYNDVTMRFDNDTTVRFNEKYWKYDENGRADVTYWPYGFCDTNMNYCQRLLRGKKS